jgi:PST family polysaccharide transporter
LLAALAAPIIELLYGEKWSAAAAALGGLGIFGALRVVFDVWVSYLIARGATGAVLRIQAIWLIALTPAMYFAVSRFSLWGAGWVHAIVAVIVTLPAYLGAMSRRGVRSRRILSGLAIPAVASVAAGLVAWRLATNSDQQLLQILIGGMGGVVTYTTIVLALWFATGTLNIERPIAAQSEAQKRTWLLSSHIQLKWSNEHAVGSRER